MAVHQVQFDTDAVVWASSARPNEVNGSSGSPVLLRTSRKRVWSYFTYQFSPYDMCAALLGEPITSDFAGGTPHSFAERNSPCGIYWMIRKWREVAMDEDQPIKIRMDCMDRIREVQRLGMACHPVFKRAQRGEQVEEGRGRAPSDSVLVDGIQGKRPKVGVA